MGIWSDFLQLFFPRQCVACERRLIDGEEFLCLECLQQIPRTHYINCKENPLEILFSGRIPFQRVASFAYFSKEGILQKIVHELKYKNNPELGNFLGCLVGHEYKGNSFFETVDYIVPIPLHPKRLRERGYNQSFQICKGLADASGIALEANNLERIVNNPSQTTLKQTERWANVDGIFSVKDSRMFAGKHILLVDDILTTGSTIESCSKQILECEQAKISIFVLGATI